MNIIVDSNSNAILTMIEISTNYLVMAKLKEGKKAMPLAKTVWRLLLPYKGENLKTITTEVNFLHMNGLLTNLECRCSLRMHILHGRKVLLKTPIN